MILRGEIWRCVVLFTGLVISSAARHKYTSEEETAAAQLLEFLEEPSSRNCEAVVLKSWAFNTNITDVNKKALEEVQKASGRFQKERYQNITKWQGSWQNFDDEMLKRQFKKLSVLGTAALPEKKLTKYNQLVTEMQATYSTAKVRLRNRSLAVLANVSSDDLSLDPDLTQILRTSRDPGVLQEVWEKWRAGSGRKVRTQYHDFTKLANEAARLNNFTDMGNMWLVDYESPTFRSDMAHLWSQLRPLYEQLHAYVRRKLREQYGEDLVSKTGPIPAHLLGNMWAQTWDNVYDLMKPYPHKTKVDVTEELVKQGYTPLKMFQLSDQFFASLNLTKMPKEFWDHSLIEKPKGREVVCHASAWDFCNGKDFRIKMCTTVNMEDLITIHHEMGHTQYYVQYKHLPLVFREGANSGFHEAVGDVLALSVSTPKHLHKIGLLPNYEVDNEADINFLMKMALSKIVFLPFGYLIDRWRWDVFSGAIPQDDWNCAWWKLRYELQGLKPPVMRTEDDFDPAAKYHVVANVPYIRYFVSFILQFQFHKALCLKAGEYDPGNSTLPLHHCDIDKSAAAGNALSDMLKLGSSKPWPDALEAITGARQMDASVIREYFKPLEEWLKKNNQDHGEHIGWESDGEYCMKKPAMQGSKQESNTRKLK